MIWIYIGYILFMFALAILCIISARRWQKKQYGHHMPWPWEKKYWQNEIHISMKDVWEEMRTNWKDIFRFWK